MKLTGSASTSYNISLRSAQQVLIISSMDLFAWILTLAIVAGQLIKLPIQRAGGITILDMVVIFLCLLGFLKLKFKLKKPPVSIGSAFLLISIVTLSLILTPLHLSSQEILISFLYTVRFTMYILLGWLIYSQAFPLLQKNIGKVLVFSGISLAVLGLLQFIFLPNLRFLEKYSWDPHYFRTTSTFLDPNFLGAYLVLTLLLFMSLRSHKVAVAISEYKIASSLKLLAMTAVYLALLTTFSRGAYLAFLTSFLTVSFFHKSVKLAVTTILLFVVLLLGFSAYQKLVAQPRGIDRAQSAEFRVNTWQQGWQLFQKHPILGVGFNTYKFALRQYNLADEKFLSSRGASSNDSSLLHVASTTGIVGLLSYLFFLFSYAWTGRHNSILLSGLLGLIAQSFFANTLFYPFLLLWIILIAVFKQTK